MLGDGRLIGAGFSLSSVRVSYCRWAPMGKRDKDLSLPTPFLAQVRPHRRRADLVPLRHQLGVNPRSRDPLLWSRPLRPILDDLLDPRTNFLHLRPSSRHRPHRRRHPSSNVLSHRVPTQTQRLGHVPDRLFLRVHQMPDNRYLTHLDHSFLRFFERFVSPEDTGWGGRGGSIPNRRLGQFLGVGYNPPATCPNGFPPLAAFPGSP